MERREFRDDLHAADEGHRLHDVSDIATEPRFRRETRLAALVASEAHDGSLAIVRCEAVESALFNWTVRTSFISARSEARYTAYPSTVAFSITGRKSSIVEEFVSFPSRTGSS